MAYPPTLLDDFTAADGTNADRTVSAGGRVWGTFTFTGHTGSGHIVSNVLQGTVGEDWSNVLFPAVGRDFSVKAKLTALGALDAVSAYIQVRVQTRAGFPTTYGDTPFYAVIAERITGSNNDNLLLKQNCWLNFAGFTETNLTAISGSATGFDWAANDTFGATFDETPAGTLITTYRNDVQQAVYLDKTSGRQSGPGYLSLEIDSQNSALDDLRLDVDDVGAPTPSAPVLDTFTRPDEDPIVTNWTTPQNTGDPDQTLQSNQFGGRGTTAYYDVTQFYQDQEAIATIGALPGADGFNQWIRLRIQGVGAAAATHYAFGIISAAGVWTANIIGTKNGSTLGNISGDINLGFTPVVGDKMCAQAIGDTLNLWIYHGGSWRLIVTATDSQIQGAGYIGLACDDGTMRWDDFAAGNIGTAPTFVQASAGTAITGASGTISISGCKAGNFLILHELYDGDDLPTHGSGVNVEDLTGAAASMTFLSTYQVGSPEAAIGALYVGRVTADGTCSVDATAAGTGGDIFARFYEFNGVNAGSRIEDVLENQVAGNYAVNSANTSAGVVVSSVGTRGPNRLAVNFQTINTNQAITYADTVQGGTWRKPVTEFSSGAGTAGTVGILTAPMYAGGDIYGGGYTITSAAWNSVSFALRPLTTYADEVLSDLPAAYWRMNDPLSFPNDWSGNAHHVTSIAGSPAYSIASAIPSDATDTAISLPAFGDSFSVPDHADLDLGDVFTIEGWVKRTVNDANAHALVSKQTGAYYLRIATDDTLNLLRSATTDICHSTVTITDTTNWHHVVATKSGSTVHLYIDGVDVTGSVTNDTCANNASALLIGNDASGGENFGAIVLDEIAVYPTALTAARVRAHYLASPDLTFDPPVIDTFTGSNGTIDERIATPGGGRWESPTFNFDQAIQISSNAVPSAAGGNRDAVIDSVQYGPDADVGVTISQIASGCECIVAMFSGAWTFPTGYPGADIYSLEIQPGGGGVPAHLLFNRNVGATFTTLDEADTATNSLSGDAYGFSVAEEGGGTRIGIWRKPVGETVWTLHGSVLDMTVDRPNGLRYFYLEVRDGGGTPLIADDFMGQTTEVAAGTLRSIRFLKAFGW